MRKMPREIGQYSRPDQVCIKCGRVWQWEKSICPAGGSGDWNLEPTNIKALPETLKRLRKEAAAERRKAGME